MNRIILLAVLLLPTIAINADPKIKFVKMVAKSAGVIIYMKVVVNSLINLYKPANKFNLYSTPTTRRI